LTGVAESALGADLVDTDEAMERIAIDGITVLWKRLGACLAILRRF